MYLDEHFVRLYVGQIDFTQLESPVEFWDYQSCRRSRHGA